MAHTQCWARLADSCHVLALSACHPVTHILTAGRVADRRPVRDRLSTVNSKKRTDAARALAKVLFLPTVCRFSPANGRPKPFDFWRGGAHNSPELNGSTVLCTRLG